MSAYRFSRTPKKVPFVSTAHRSIQTPIPCKGTDQILAHLDRFESRSMHGQLPIIWARAKDYSVYDADDNRWIDFTSGIFVSNVGHSNARVTHAIHEALRNGTLHSYTYANLNRAWYLQRLVDWSGFSKAFLVSSGTEATEAALRLMRLYGRAVGKRSPGIVCVDGAFHGRTLGAQMMGGRSDFKDPNIHHIRFPDPFIYGKRGYAKLFEDAMTELYSDGVDLDRDLCGFMLETFQGWSAAFYSPDWVQAVESFCRQHDLLLCFDEMQAGFARTGRKFGYEHYGVTPDLICVGKGMGGGVPLSGVLGRSEIMDLPEPGDMSSTHSANPMCCAAGLAVINEIERLDLVKEADRKGRLLDDRLHEIQKRLPQRIIKVNGKGMIAALLTMEEGFASAVVEWCMQRGLLVVHTGENSIKIGPPLTIPDGALLEGLDVLEDAIRTMDCARLGMGVPVSATG